jgi:signal transduction histidine kinase/CheY-like chemotaxis protein
MPIPAALALVALSLEIACAAVMFFIARAPGWSRVRLMGLIATSAAAYCAVNLVSFSLSSDAPLLRWVFEINLLNAAIHACMWIWFTFADADGSWCSVPRWARWQGLAALVAAAAVAVAGAATDPDSAFTVSPGLRGVSTIGYQLTTAGNVVAVLIVSILVSCGWEYFRRARSGQPGARGILVGFALFGLCIVEEALVAAGTIEFYFLSDVGYLFIVVPLAGQLIGRFSDDARRLSQLSVELATEVEARTSERDAARESLVEQQRLAALGRLAAGVGHEINNPLQYVISNLEELESAESAREPSWQHNALSNAIEGAERIRRVVEGLRRYGAVSERFEPVALHDVVRTALRIAEPQLRAVANIRTTLNPVPHVLGDEGQLVQCVVNHLVNAAQSLVGTRERGESEIAITTGTCKNGSARVLISDNGNGFPEDLLPRLGEPYVSTRVQQGGTGLGIFLSHGLIVAHGGTLSLRNAETGGAVVEICLPAAAIPPSEGAVQNEPLTERIADPAARRARHILLVDDEPALVAVLQRGLSRLGHTVVAARDGAEALALAQNDAFDVVLSDLMMPHMSGAELAAALADQHPRLRERMLIMTGGAVSDEHSAFLERADVIVVEKPVRLAELAAIIDRLT